jgi:hypothetical protein
MATNSELPGLEDLPPEAETWPKDHAALYSAAVSAKRTADAVDGIYVLLTDLCIKIDELVAAQIQRKAPLY